MSPASYTHENVPQSRSRSPGPVPVDDPQKKQRRCPYLCTLIPKDVPAPSKTQAVLHPRKDVFVLKVAKVGSNGDRRCKMELELVTPKLAEKPNPYRMDTREIQCDPECPPCNCCCMTKRTKTKDKKEKRPK